MPIAEWNKVTNAWEKTCNSCGRMFISNADKWPTAFQDFLVNFDRASYTGRSTDELYPACRECKNHQRHGRRSNGLFKKEMLDLQSSKCAICEAEICLNVAKIDHDHDTGKIRGLLCHRCNLRMSPVDDDTWLAKAVAYRDKFRCE